MWSNKARRNNLWMSMRKREHRMFYLICEMLYDLAGDTGNLLLYGLAANEVRKALNSFDELFTVMGKTMQFLFSKAEKHYNNYNQGLIDRRSNAKWAESCYKSLVEAYSSFNENITKCKDAVNDTFRLIKKLEDPNYLNWMKRKIAFLIKSIEFFSKTVKAIVVEDNYHQQGRLSQFPDRAIGKPLVDHTNKDEIPSELLKNAMKFYEENNLAEGLKIFLHLVKMNPDNLTLRFFV
jgi:hypothetical protein